MQSLGILLRSLIIFLCVAGGSAAAAEQVAKPRLVLVGDSTVKNGTGKGDGGLWGWGQVVGDLFDSERIDVENRALGGRSSRTYQTEGLWERSLARLRPGDFVLIQFGHNDGGEKFKGDRPRASIKGNDDSTETGIVEMTGKEETVHSYGWYLRKYIADAKARGATPIVLSLVPRNIWKDGHIIRAKNDYGKWAAEAARQGDALFIDLNEIVASRYEAAGEETVRSDYFTSADHTHTTKAGAVVNATCVAEGIRGLGDCPLGDYLLPTAKKPKNDFESKTSFQFDFGSGAVADGYLQVLPTDVYSRSVGYGFEPRTKPTRVSQADADPLAGDACQGDGPFYFSVTLPEGNYRVTAICSDADGGPITIKAELRRLMVEKLCASPERPATCEFTVNIRRPSLPDGSVVRLKDREKTSEAWAWDEKLTLEFNGREPRLNALTVRPEPEAVTVFLAGDSTVTDQALEPWNSWGQMLPGFFQPGVAIANHAESGESVRSSLGARRFDKIFSLLKPGDYLFFQFGHNDMKDPAPDALATYRANLEQLVEKTRQRRAHPVLVTSMERKAGLENPTLGDYPQTVREIAQEHDVPLIDLNAMSKVLYKSLGEDLDAAFQDGTHHTNYGSYLLARCVVQGICDIRLPLANYFRNDVTSFDPSRPEPLRLFAVPANSISGSDPPEGN